MRNIFLKILLVAFLLLLTTESGAAPAYGTKMPRQNRFFAGLQSHQVFERELEGANGEIESLQHFVLLSYGVFDWLSLDLKGGVGDIDQSPDGMSVIHYHTFMAGGYGFRARLFEDEEKKTRVVFGFQHISVHPYSRDIEGNSTGSKFKAVLDDWQFSILGSYDFGPVNPYIGGRWSRMDNIYWVDGRRNRIKSDTDNSFGAIVGADIPVTDRIWINVEGNFVDAQALAASLNLSF